MWVKGANKYAYYFEETKVDFDGTNVAFTMKSMAGTNDEAAMACTGVLTTDRIAGTVEFTMKVPPPLKVPPWPR